MKLQTKVEIPDFQTQITHANKLMFIGSCFTENIGNKLVENLFKADINPFGVLYNPISVKNSLEILLQNKKFLPSDLEKHNKLWFSYYHHSSFSDTDKNACLNKINSRIEASAKFIQNTDLLFVTFGTAWVYKLKSNEQTVSNCHKIPAQEFERELLSIEKITENYNILISLLTKKNPKIKIFFTVSPVRHLKDGAIENQRSKSVLLLSIAEIVKKHKNCHYFPSYEIVMDEMRDYRFYDKDLTHLNELGTEYVWQKFSETFFSAKTLEKMNKANKLITNLNHKPRNPNSKDYLEFRKKNLEKIKEFILNFD